MDALERIEEVMTEEGERAAARFLRDRFLATGILRPGDELARHEGVHQTFIIQNSECRMQKVGGPFTRDREDGVTEGGWGGIVGTITAYLDSIQNSKCRMQKTGDGVGSDNGLSGGESHGGGGLPMDHYFSDYLGELRKGRRLAEIGGFATLGLPGRKAVRLMLAAYRWVCQAKIDLIVCGCDEDRGRQYDLAGFRPAPVAPRYLPSGKVVVLMVATPESIYRSRGHTTG